MSAEVAPRDEPTLWINADGTVGSANEAAMALLGVGLEDLRAMPPGSLAAEPSSPDEQAALRAQWEAAGGGALVGLTTIKRADGTRVRVAFAIAAEPDGSFVASLNPAPGPKAAPTRIYAVGDVLRRWRTAERELETLSLDAPEYAAIQAEIEALRAQYHRLFEARLQAS